MRYEVLSRPGYRAPWVLCYLVEGDQARAEESACACACQAIVIGSREQYAIRPEDSTQRPKIIRAPLNVSDISAAAIAADESSHAIVEGADHARTLA